MNRWMKRRIEKSRERCERVEEQQKKAGKDLPMDHNPPGDKAKSGNPNALNQSAPVLQSAL
jgi:hypothetical protein